jgi:pantetheine-phosphate adenylyltransferase
MKDLEYVLNDFKENQHLDYLVWLKRMEKKFDSGLHPYKALTEILPIWEPKIGIYAGSFNPLHLGHYNILLKAEDIFDKVIIARGLNPDKKESEFDLPEKIKNRQIIYYDGLLTDMMCNLGYKVTLIRGLRNATDLQYELTQFQFLQDMMPGISIVNIFCDKEFEHISSSAIRNLMKYGDTYKKYLL